MSPSVTVSHSQSLSTRPSALGMSNPGVDPLEILEVPEFIGFLKFLEGDELDLTNLVHLVQSVHLAQNV